MTVLRNAYQLSENERQVGNVTRQFISGRLAEPAVAEWALNLKPIQLAERVALRDVFEYFRGGDLHEPWLSFWSWVLESWDSEPPSDHATNAHRIGELIRRGDRSRPLIQAVVDSVRPWPTLTQRKGLTAKHRKGGKPKLVSDLISVSLTSRDLPNWSALRLADTEPDFLYELADALEAAVRYGVGAIRRFESGNLRSWRLGQLHRAYPVVGVNDDGDDGDPDRFNHGIAPSVKLLYSVLVCLASKSTGAAKQFIVGWDTEESPIFRRLWAAIARDASLVEGTAVQTFLTAASDDVFWRIREFPEVAELRAVRFGDLSDQAALSLARRIVRLPPRRQWPPQLQGQKLEEARRYSALRELKRIQLAGHSLPGRAATWYDANSLDMPDLQLMSKIDEGFPEGVRVHWSGSTADLSFDALKGADRLSALESALSAERTFDDNPKESAYHWIALPGRLANLVEDFEGVPNFGSYVLLWAAIGWARPTDGVADNAEAKTLLASRMLRLIDELPTATTKQSVRGLCDWLDAWTKFAAKSPLLYRVWLTLWPHAVALTNITNDVVDFDSAWDEEEPRNDIDTLNNPVGKLVGVFLEYLPELKDVPRPFEREEFRRMREEIVSAPGRAGLIGQYRLVEYLRWMLAADAEWSRDNLIRLVKAGDRRSFILFRALSWRTQFAAVQEIGSEMAAAAVDPRADRPTRKAMAWSLVAYMLNCFWEEMQPTVPIPQVQQMLRLCDDEVRAHCADILKRFVEEVSAGSDGTETRLERASRVFEKAVAPALKLVWPQERSLSTPGVARALADLPAASGSAFVAAVAAVERFIVPFDAWSMLEFGLHGAEDESPKLAQIDDVEKAQAFLRLLDLSIGSGDGAVVPYDLALALNQIQAVAPELLQDQRYRRLAALSR